MRGSIRFMGETVKETNELLKEQIDAVCLCAD